MLFCFRIGEMLKIYNSLSKKVEKFTPLEKGRVGIYACGPTVYDFPHIGHGRKYVNDDVLKRVLREVEGFEVRHVQNITDVGHLVSDADEGEDKLEKGARKFGKSVWEVAKEYTEYFLEAMDKLNIVRPDVQCKATDHIEEQIAVIKTLIDKGYAYETDEAVYYDVSKFADYGKLFGQSMEEKIVGAREEVETETSKKNPYDFALWFKRVGKFADHVMHWGSPWGEGFPGWHIECSAMSMKYLGEQIDIHTGGEDHMSIHHPNEIAQSEAASGKKPFVKYWFHTVFLMVDGKKMSKSLGNFYRVEDIETKGFSPMMLRYYYLSTHYRKQMNFTWEAMEGVAAAYKRLKNEYTKLAYDLESHVDNIFSKDWDMDLTDRGMFFRDEFVKAVEDDLNMPAALAVLWNTVRDSQLMDFEKRKLVDNFDRVLGLRLADQDESLDEVPEEVKGLVSLREEMRLQKNWVEADNLRRKIEEMGYALKDSSEGTVLEAK